MLMRRFRCCRIALTHMITVRHFSFRTDSLLAPYSFQSADFTYSFATYSRRAGHWWRAAPPLRHNIDDIFHHMRCRQKAAASALGNWSFAAYASALSALESSLLRRTFIEGFLSGRSPMRWLLAFRLPLGVVFAQKTDDITPPRWYFHYCCCGYAFDITFHRYFCSLTLYFSSEAFISSSPILTPIAVARLCFSPPGHRICRHRVEVISVARRTAFRRFWFVFVQVSWQGKQACFSLAAAKAAWFRRHYRLISGFFRRAIAASLGLLHCVVTHSRRSYLLTPSISVIEGT